MFFFLFFRKMEKLLIDIHFIKVNFSIVYQKKEFRKVFNYDFFRVPRKRVDETRKTTFRKK